MSLGITSLDHQKTILSGIQTLRAQVIQMHGRGVQVWHKDTKLVPGHRNPKGELFSPLIWPRNKSRKKKPTEAENLTRIDLESTFLLTPWKHLLCWLVWLIFYYVQCHKEIFLPWKDGISDSILTMTATIGKTGQILVVFYQGHVSVWNIGIQGELEKCALVFYMGYIVVILWCQLLH